MGLGSFGIRRTKAPPAETGGGTGGLASFRRLKIGGQRGGIGGLGEGIVSRLQDSAWGCGCLA